MGIFPFQGRAQHIRQDLCQAGTRSEPCSIPIMYRTFSHATGLPTPVSHPRCHPWPKTGVFLLALNDMASMIGTRGPQSDAIRVDPGKRGR